MTAPHTSSPFPAPHTSSPFPTPRASSPSPAPRTTRLATLALAALALAPLALTACREAPPADDHACSCVPANRSLTRLRDGTAVDGPALLSRLRRHRQDVAAGRNPRDIKVMDDELRFAISNFCQPCGAWVADRTTMEELYPLTRLDDAVDAVCMGLVLRDGTTAYGDARRCR